MKNLYLQQLIVSAEILRGSYAIDYMNHFIKQHQLSYKMETKQLVYKAFDIWCLKIYNKKYPPTDNNLYKFLGELYKDYIEGEEEYHVKYSKRLCKIILDMEKSQLFILQLKEFIKQHEQVTI